MAIITIHDANILIDLLQLEIIDDLITADIEIHTTNIVVEEHLDSHQRAELEDFIQTKKIKVKGYQVDEIFDITELIREKDMQLSSGDCSILHISIEKKAILLSGDKRLKRLAQQEGVEVHGILWIFDLLVDKNIFTFSKAKEQLEKLMQLNQWLPKAECEERLKKWDSVI